MATDNKSKNDRELNSDEDTTSELEIVLAPSTYVDEEAESDASTYPFGGDHPDDRSIDSLRSDLQSRDDRIGQLQFDTEQLRARWSGLEKEITAREELTDVLQKDIRIADEDRSRQHKLIIAQNHEIESLTSDLDAAREQATKLRKLELELSGAKEELPVELQETVVLQDDALSKKTESQGETLFVLQRQLEQSRIKVSELKAYIDGRKNDWARLGKDLESYKISITASNEAIEGLEQDATEKQRTLLSAQRKVEKLEGRLTKELAGARQLRKTIRALSRDIDNYQINTQFNVEQRIAEQSGQLVSNRDEISELKGQISRSERYADELRENLRTLDIVSTKNTNKREQLDASLEQATAQVRDLKEQLDAERIINADLSTSNNNLREEFEQEVLKIRFELGSAQETIGDYESVNEQLASNLIDNTHFRQALEDQLRTSEEEYVLEISKLKNRLRKIEQQIEDAQRKINNKDNAITALLSELASKSQTIDSIGEIGTVISEIETRMSERIEDSSGPDRERPTRLLIGMIDGQEVQFPLFKERLTIGRTLQNDIQLKAQCISRRHALILCDEDGPRIIDWGSKNGVSVNGEKVSEQKLHNGDKVTIGTAEFIFEERQKR